MEKAAQVNEWFTRLVCLLFSNFDGTETDYDTTSSSHFSAIVAHVKPVEQKMTGDSLINDIILFFLEIVQLHVEDKERIEKVGQDMICRDICPRHLLDDMRQFGEQKLAEFSNLYNNEEVLLQIYGNEEGKEALNNLHTKLDALIGIVEVFC